MRSRVPAAGARACACLALGSAVAGCTTGDQGSADRALSGSEGTVEDTSGTAFALALQTLPATARRAFQVGNSFLNRNWVTAPASTTGPGDRDRDGISGRPNRVAGERGSGGAVARWRFGWKANVATVRRQNAGAFTGDIGITSPVFREENRPPGQRACPRARTRGLAEAILWHGSEAHGARERFRRLPARERRDLVAFLESL